ncbi:MAG: carboxypeptidase regulatory-like domain-containing protein [Terracidiphilus sp.]|jgi:hypothetical protein
MASKVARRGFIFAALCSFLLPAPAAIAYVPIFSVVKSGQHAHIETTTDAKPLPGASVEVYRGFGRHGEFPKSKALLILTSDQHGEVTLPTLPSGKYLIVAQSGPNLKDWLYLDLSSNERSAQPLGLALIPQPPTFEQRLAAVEASTDIATVSQLRGIVCDRNGYPIPKATVDVLIKGTQGKKHAAKLRTDVNGRFSADIAEGQYLLNVSAQGFAESFRSVTVSRPGSGDELQIKLEIAPSST